MASKYLFSKTTRLSFSFSFSSPSSHRSYTQDFHSRSVSSSRWTGIKSRTTPTSRPLPNPHPFVAWARYEETSHLTLEQKIHQHITRENTLIFAGPERQQQQQAITQDIPSEQYHNSNHEVDSDITTSSTMGRSGYDTTNMHHQGLPPRRPAAAGRPTTSTRPDDDKSTATRSARHAKKKGGVMKEEAPHGALSTLTTHHILQAELTRQQKLMAQQQYQYHQQQQQQQQQHFGIESQQRASWQTQTGPSNRSQRGALPSLEGRGWTFWF